MLASRSLSLLVPLAWLGAAACASAPPPHVEGPPGIAPAPDPDLQPPGLRLPDDVRPLAYDVDLKVIPGEARFSGTVAIRLHLERPRHMVWLHASTDLHVTGVSVDGRPAAFVAHTEESGLASVRLPADAPSLAPGDVTLRITWDAPFSHGGDAVFAVSEAGRHYALTTFEPVSARRALPCFDEPALKAPFTLSLTVPEGAVALANSAEVSTEPAGPGLVRVRFATTPPLPTYLFSFAVGPFELVSAPTLPASPLRDRPLPIRAVTLAGKGDRVRAQLAQVGPLVDALERWFGVAYPFDKLDVVAVPGFPGAMENAGLVTFDESLLVVGDDAAIDDRRDALTTLAHELAHQWFGNLVTMAWWDDLWLNEAFATWLSHPIAASVRPELGLESLASKAWRRAMEADAKPSVRRIRQPIASEHDIYAAFDGITYSKGSRVIAMFERWVGAAAWQRGVRDYIAAHAFGNATVDDLVTAVSRAAGTDIGPAFRSFLDTPGAPLVTITIGERTGGRTRVAFDVARWRPVGAIAATSPTSGAWQVPVCLAGATLPREHCVLLDAPHSELELPLDVGAAPLVPNAGGAGYYQTLLHPPAVARAALLAPHPPAEAAVLVQAWIAAFDSGALPAGTVLDALMPLANSAEPELVRALLGLLTRIGEHLVDDAARPAFEQRVRRALAPLGRRLGWQVRPGEATEQGSLRAALLELLAKTARDPAVLREAGRRGRALLHTARGDDRRPAGGRHTTAPDLRALALSVALEQGGTAALDEALGVLFASEDPLLRGELLAALTALRDPAIAARGRDALLDPRLTETELQLALDAQFADARQRLPALAWLEAHIDDVLRRLPPFNAGFTPQWMEGFCDERAHTRAVDLFTPRMGALPGAPQALAEALERIEMCVALRAAQGDSVRAWIAGERR